VTGGCGCGCGAGSVATGWGGADAGWLDVTVGSD